ncbi:hypothetical protein J6TS2_50860 [Heyndrickxia sporothermodurans]|nr:hypothetical protein J6TS2_50860 [Heyndrickxia sporothermodurans]
MEYLLGALVAVVFFILLLSTLYIGYQLGTKKQKHKVKHDEEEARKAEMHRSNFIKLMNYDVSTALQRKKVD